MPRRNRPGPRLLLATLLAWATLAAVGAEARKHHDRRSGATQIQDVSSARRKAQEVQRKLAEARAKVQELKRKEAVHVQKLSEMQQQVEQTTARLEDSRYKLSRAQNQLSRTKSELETTQGKLQTERGLASHRLRTMFKLRRINNWEALLTAPDLVAFLTRYQYLKHISQDDQRLLEHLSGLVVHINHQKKQIDQLVTATTNLTQSIAAEKQEQVHQTKAEASLVERIKTERAAWEAAENQLERSSRDLEAMIRRLMARNTNHPRLGTGRFTYPAGGRITSGFGMRMHPIYHVAKPHRGIDFGPGYGAPVVAADTGIVLFSGWYDGYGKIVMIDHGENTVTLYGHLSAFSVAAGERVTRGQHIGSVGSTGLSTGPHLHFEVRRNGTPVNPLGYLR